MRSIFLIILLVLFRLHLRIRRLTRTIQVTNLSVLWINLSGRNVFGLLTALTVDDPEVYNHGPVAVQIVGRRLREEQILEMADTVSKALHR
jgi:Asp-tRNA(Asn)/Glu-tRNA(Gln) amidotransferase A subunit family amidase